MKGDFSRIPFDPTRHYAGVLHQQGRVWLDSDWNEEVAERLALLRQELRDLVGPCGVPAAGTFQISASADARPDNFQISGGHGYVDGVLCEIGDNVSYLNQPDYPDAPRINIPTDGTTLTALIYLEVWHRLITYLEDDSIREVALGGPDTSVRLKTIAQVKVVTVPNGIAKCADASPSLPQAGRGQLTTLQPAVNPALTACQLPDPANFTGRENHLFRVEVHDGGDVSGAGTGFAFSVALAADVAAGATSLTLSKALTPDQAGAAIRAGFVALSDNIGASERVAVAGLNAPGTVISLGRALATGYTVANAAIVTGGVARFKWSRDNASFAVAVTNVKADRVSITLASLGRDLATTFRQGDLVEITDDASELGPARGHLTFLKTDPDPDMLTVQIADALPPAFVLNGEVSSRHLVLRRWDGVGDASSAFDASATPGMNLGDGVHVQFSGLDLRAGDYWQFAVRAADGSVQALTNADPAGINRRRCPLAVVTWGPPPRPGPPALTLVQDCRRVFPGLVDFPQPEKGFHINAVFSVNSANAETPLLNDTDVHVDAFNGIDILCDAPPDPASVSRPTCILAVESPATQNNSSALWYFPLVLAGAVSVDTTKSLISWRALPQQTQSLLTDMINSSPNERGVLARLTLKSRFIWALNNPNLFLDGEAFGQRLSATNNTALQLPSGDNRKGGDFEMWFWIVAALSFSKQIVAVPAQIYVGETSTFTVTLSSAAPAGVAAIATTNAAVASVPATVQVPAGATSVPFAVKGLTAGVATVSATFGTPPVVPQTTLTVLALPLLTGQISFAPAAILVGGVATATITLNAPAPSSGAVINLVTSNAQIVGLPQPPTVTVPAGASSATFPVSSPALGATGTATITGTLTWPDRTTSNVSGNITVRIVKTKELSKDIRDTKLTEKVTVEKVREIKVAEAQFGPGPAAAVAHDAALPQGTGRSFIRPEERPAVEQQVLDASRPDENVP